MDSARHQHKKPWHRDPDMPDPSRCVALDLQEMSECIRWSRKPQNFTYHLCAEDIARAGLADALRAEDKGALLEDGLLPPESSAKRRACVMCPVRIGYLKLLPCCLCENWCNPECSYQTHLGRVCPCHIRILDPERKIMVLSQPYMEDYVVLPTRSGVRTESRLAEWDLNHKKARDN